MAVRIASWLLPFWVVLLFTGASSHGADLLAPLVDLQSDELQFPPILPSMGWRLLN